MRDISILKIVSVKTTVTLTCLLLLSPQIYAHVKWFIPSQVESNSAFIPYSFNDIEVLVWIGMAVMMISASIFLDSRLPSVPIVNSKIRKEVITVLRVCTGMSLLLTAYAGSVIAPHYEAVSTFDIALLFLEVMIAILLISNHFIFQASLMMLALYLGLIFRFGFFETIEYWNIIGIALFLMFNNFSKPTLQDKYKPYSVSALRIFTGIALITLGLSEKLLGAEYGEAFVDQYQWNFMFNLGLESFSDRLFVLSAGVMEVVFGIILILGTTTRLNFLVVSGFMLTSNITFLVQGNNSAAIMELIGHLPIMATAVICIFFGYGQRLKVTSLFKRIT